MSLLVVIAPGPWRDRLGAGSLRLEETYVQEGGRTKEPSLGTVYELPVFLEAEEYGVRIVVLYHENPFIALLGLVDDFGGVRPKFGDRGDGLDTLGCL